MIRRNTVQRALVLNTVRLLHCHPTAEEIYAAIAAEHPAVSRSTVYRNLQQLCEAGEVRRVELPGSPDRYDHTTRDHYHARCLCCGSVTDVEMACREDLLSAVTDSHGYVLQSQAVLFGGICPACRKAEAQLPSCGGES